MSTAYLPNRTVVSTGALNQVLRNTYLLMSLMLGVSALTAWFAISSGTAPINRWLMLAFFIGMPFAIYAARNNVFGLVLSFAYAALLGYFLGPIVGLYLRADPKIPMYAFVMTSVIFGAMTTIALTSKRDFSMMRGMLVIGSLVALGAIIANMIFQIAMLSIVISSVVVVLSAGWILYSTQQAARGGEDNYIVLATSLFSDIWVLFMHLMNIFNAFSSD
jgi:modulator of FtsH protease